MCVYAVGSPIREPMVMNANGKNDNGRQGNQPQPPYYLTELPQCRFYQQGISGENRGWIEVIIASIKNARGRYLVTIVAIWALSKVACEFLEKGSSNLSYKSIISTLLIAGMVLIIGLISLRKNEDINVEKQENRKESEIKPAESGTGGNSPDQDRRTSERNRGPNHDGGSE
jgi:hypothetical protein